MVIKAENTTGATSRGLQLATRRICYFRSVIIAILGTQSQNDLKPQIITVVTNESRKYVPLNSATHRYCNCDIGDL